MCDKLYFGVLRNKELMSEPGVLIPFMWGKQTNRKSEKGSCSREKRWRRQTPTHTFPYPGLSMWLGQDLDTGSQKCLRLGYTRHFHTDKWRKTKEWPPNSEVCDTHWLPALLSWGRSMGLWARLSLYHLWERTHLPRSLPSLCISFLSAFSADKVPFIILHVCTPALFL